MLPFFFFFSGWKSSDFKGLDITGSGERVTERVRREKRSRWWGSPSLSKVGRCTFSAVFTDGGLRNASWRTRKESGRDLRYVHTNVR